MDNGKKRKRDSSVPILVYSAPGHHRFAKLFTETSLDDVKEIVRSRLELSSISDFTLFYDTDISLLNDDDFAAFEVHARSSSSAVTVVVNLLSPTPLPSVDGPSVVENTSASDPVDGVTRPARKKRKVDPGASANLTASAPAPQSTAKPISSAQPRKQKSNANLVDTESISTAFKGSSTNPKPPGGKELPKKKRKRNDHADSSARDDPSAKVISEPAQEGPPKKSKKLVEVDSADEPAQTTAVPSTVTEAPEPQVVDPQRPKNTTRTRSKSVSKKTNKKSKPDDQTEDGPASNRRKSVTFTDLDETTSPTDGAASSAKVVAPRQKSQNPEKVVEPGPDDVAPEKVVALKEFWDGFSKKHFVPTPAPSAVPEPEPEHAHTVKQPTGKGTKKPAETTKEPATSSETAAKDNGPALCPICQARVHLRYRCPVVLDGADSIRGRIAELEEDSSVDHSQIIQELHGFLDKALKSRKTNELKNVNAQSSHLRAAAKKGGVVNSTASGSGSHDEEEESASSNDESESVLTKTRSMAPAPVDMDAELAAIIRGPVSSRLTVGEEQEGEESVVLENDEDDDDLNFRRRSRKLACLLLLLRARKMTMKTRRISPLVKGLKAKLPQVVNISSRLESRHSPARSPTEPLGSIDNRQSVDFDLAGDMAVGDAMASDNAMFGSDIPVAVDGGSTVDAVVDLPPQPTQTPILLTPKSAPRRTSKPRSMSVIRLHTPEPADPIQPAEDFPPTPAKGTQPASPSTPRLVQHMKDRHGKTPVRLSQLPMPVFSTQPPESSQDEEVPANTQAVDEAVARTRTRSSNRLSFAASMAAIAHPPQPEQPPKKTRGPNKTQEQRAQEAAAKLAAKEEKERLRKEKAQAKAKAPKVTGKGGTQRAKSIVDTQDCPRTTPPPQDPKSPLEDPAEIPKTTSQSSRKALSQDGWTVLKATSPEEYREQESMRDELRSSSVDDRPDEPPLFLPAESQIPFPYSQWEDDEVSPGSPKDSEDEDEEEEVAASIKSSQRPVNQSASSYRRLTDIASQPLFSTTPGSRAANFPPSTFPSAKSKDQRAELYGRIPQDD
ncbi:hypothetical protein C8R46DRAFT_1053645 [Mycena filopes]|nr:hypothetical protein C8R46DRAFT_1053645 [Mycena filopes]